MQIILNGLINGLAIALLALGFQIVYLPTRVFFIGLAGLYALSPYLYMAMKQHGQSWPMCLGTTLSVVILLSVLMEKFNHAPLSHKRASEGAHLISSLGIYILVVQGIAMFWGNDVKALRDGVDATFNLGAIILSGSQAVMACVALIMLLIFITILNTTDMGLRLRALADNPAQFALYGFNVDNYRLIAFALAGVLASSSSLITSYDIGFAPNNGLHAVLLAVVSVIIGGRTSFIGPIFGGIIIGIIRAEVVWQFSAQWQEAVTFAFLAFFLLFRPQGLFGLKSRIEETA
jgi:branched-chain amino acid transport system permease protein